MPEGVLQEIVHEEQGANATSVDGVGMSQCDEVALCYLGKIWIRRLKDGSYLLGL